MRYISVFSGIEAASMRWLFERIEMVDDLMGDA